MELDRLYYLKSLTDSFSTVPCFFKWHQYTINSHKSESQLWLLFSFTPTLIAHQFVLISSPKYLLICSVLSILLTTRQSFISSNSPLASLMAQLLKHLPAMQETLVQFLGWGDPLEDRTEQLSRHLSRFMATCLSPCLHLCFPPSSPKSGSTEVKVALWRQFDVTHMFKISSFFSCCS